MAAKSLVQAQIADRDLLVAVVAGGDALADVDRVEWGGALVRIVRTLPPTAFGYAPGLAKALREHAPEVIHVHGLWLHQSIVAARHASPTVISLHGMLAPWALRNSWARKQIALRLYERTNLERAGCLHALTETEAAQVRDIGLRTPVCIIPNGIELPDLAPALEKPSMRELLFLGRLHPVKGIDDLLRGWAAFRASDPDTACSWRLSIAGWGEAKYRARLERLVAELGVVDSVTFSGPKHGPDLWRAYARADGYILTSHSEAMPMTILEAWASALPVIMTPECGLKEGETAGAALVTAREPASIAAAISAMAAKSDAERRRMGAAGRRLVETRYSWQRTARAFADIYRWLGRGTQKPDCIIS
jgi:poly(glycerol-phosphate) alpha-glucosyltransferase